jgi:hypothetical protein
MIRATAIACLVAMLATALYLPSAYPPEQFFAQLRKEHAAAAQLWDQQAASRMLDVALGLQDSARRVAPSPHPAPSAPGGPLDTAVAHEMSSVSARLFGNAYFRSVEALFLLAMFRLGMMSHALPWLLPFFAAAFADGHVSRLLKAREFRQHDPEVFALALAGAIAVACATAVALLAPIELPILAWAVAPLIVGFLISRALASFHLRA